jgi:hypothetical protein
VRNTWSGWYGAGLGVFVIVVTVLRGRGNRLRLSEVQADAGGRTIAPGADGVEVGFERGVVEADGDAAARELGGDVGIEGLNHRETHADGVDAAPRLRAVVEETEFDGKAIGLLALRDEEIDAAGVVVESSAVVGGLMVVDSLGSEPNLEDALGFVVLDEGRAHDFSQLAIGAAARGVHLPEAVLRGDVALGDKEVVQRGGVDVGHAVGVAANCYGSGEGRSGKAGKMHIAVKLGQRGYGGGAKPQDAGQGGEEKQHQEADAGPEEDQDRRSGPAAFVARFG